MDVAKGMNFLHKSKIIYRDLKVDNILIFSHNWRDNIVAKITDFGTATFFSSSGLFSCVGSPGYCAPEVVKLRGGSLQQITLVFDKNFQVNNYVRELLHILLVVIFFHLVLSLMKLLLA